MNHDFPCFSDSLDMNEMCTWPLSLALITLYLFLSLVGPQSFFFLLWIPIVIQHTSNMWWCTRIYCSVKSWKDSNRFLTQPILGTLGKLNKRRRQRYLYSIESLPFHPFHWIPYPIIQQRPSSRWSPSSCSKQLKYTLHQHGIEKVRA